MSSQLQIHIDSVQQGSVPRPPVEVSSPPVAMLIRRRRSKKCYFALRATKHEIVSPRPRPIGYLKQCRLIQQSQAGDVEARKRVWFANIRLAYSVTNKFRVRPQLMADAFQEAQLGLAAAIAKFEVERLYEFSTYAFAAMRGWTLRHRGRASFIVGIPPDFTKAYFQYRAKLERATSRSDWFDLRQEQLDKGPLLYQKLVRLVAIAEPMGLEAARAETLPDCSPDRELLRQEQAVSLWKAVQTLDERHQLVITRRYGLDGMAIATLDEVGLTLGLTKERVRQIQLKAETLVREKLSRLGWAEDISPSVTTEPAE